MLGGSGLGKSTIAAWLFAELKILHHSVELIPEYVKTRAVQRTEIKLLDQNYIFAKQQQYEARFLDYGIKNCVSDSPTMLPTLYTELYFGKKYAEPLEAMDDLYEELYPSFNILLIREGEFNPEGRYQTNPEDAAEIDVMVLRRLEEKKRDFIVISREDKKDMLTKVLEKMDS
jgi:nicotinamide riboside kinase